MDLVGILLEMGFWEGGRPKGFEIAAGRLKIWVQGEPESRARLDLGQVFQRIESRLALARSPEGWEFLNDACTGAWVQSRTDYLAISVPLSDEPCTDVWVISDRHDEAEAEKERWQARGYRVEVLSSTDAPSSTGLVVSIDDETRRFSGHLPRYPRTALMVQPWH